MMMLTHAAITGAVGEEIGNPYLAFLMGMLIHLLMDKIPHFWAKEKTGQNIIKITDSVLTAIFLLILYFVPTDHHLGLFWGGLGGIVIDIALVFLMKEKGPIAAWHTKRQPHQQKAIWLVTDILIFVFGVMLIGIFR
jgi:hypothetical protein